MKKHSVVLFGHPTSFSIEDEFWSALTDIAQAKQTSVVSLLRQIDANRTTNLSSAVRVFILKYLLENNQQNNTH